MVLGSVGTGYCKKKNGMLEFLTKIFGYVTSAPSRLSPTVKILLSSSILSWNNAREKLGSLKTLPSAKIKKLITDEILKNY